MATIIEFYIPNSFKKVACVPPQQLGGKVIKFPAQEKKSA
jgi:hypothetical protein